MVRFTLVSRAVAVALLAAACSKRAPAEGPVAARGHAVTASAVKAGDAGARASAGAGATQEDAGAGQEAPAFLLVEVLDRRQALVLLDGEAPPRPRALADGGVGAPELLAKGPIATAALPLARGQLSAAAGAALAERWVLGGIGPKAPTCTATRKGLVDVARIGADDPTVGEGTKGAALALRAFEVGSHAVAAVVDLPAGCGSPAWAVREGTPLPRQVTTARLDRAATARLEGVMARASAAYKDLPSGASLERSFEATAVGKDRAWVRALRAEPGSPHMACAMLDLAASPPKILAETFACPADVAGVTEHGTDLVVWAGAGALRVHGSAIEATFFPTASFVPYGAP